MPAVKEIHIAVGTPTGRRSTVWKFFVRKSDVYIQTRMFGSDSKVSLHSTGDCQWSATDDWVKKVPGRRNADRHFTKWYIPRPCGSSALHIFQVRVPETELRVSGLPEDLSAVEWLPVPPAGHTVLLECYLTPLSEADPALTSQLPYPHLFSLPLADGRWFTVLQHIVPLNNMDLETLRMEINQQSRATGIEPRPEYRVAAFSVNGSGTRGLIELCAVGGCELTSL